MSSSSNFAWESSIVEDQKREEREKQKKRDEEYIQRQEAKRDSNPDRADHYQRKTDRATNNYKSSYGAPPPSKNDSGCRVS